MVSVHYLYLLFILYMQQNSIISISLFKEHFSSKNILFFFFFCNLHHLFPSFSTPADPPQRDYLWDSAVGRLNVPSQQWCRANDGPTAIRRGNVVSCRPDVGALFRASWVGILLYILLRNLVHLLFSLFLQHNFTHSWVWCLCKCI